MIRTGLNLDAAAMLLSAGCLVHCLMLPIAASMLPVLGVAAEAEWVHWAFVALALPISASALFRDISATGLAWTIRAMAGLGLCLLILGALGWPAHEWETPLTVIGALTLASAHIVNFTRRHAR